MTSRQFYIMLFIGVISMKMQKLPSIIYGELGKNGYLIVLLYMLVNLFLICLVFFILKRVKFERVFSAVKNKGISFTRRLIMLGVTMYLLSQALLLYEHIQGLFANTLFDNFSWALFSLLLLFAVFFLAHRGVENIALNYEIYFYVIVASYIIISILGFSHSDLSIILPFETISMPQVFKQIPYFSFWFGDAILVLILGMKSREIKLSKTIIVYSVAMLFMTLMVVEFFGIYGEYSDVQSGLISVISGQSLLGLNVGRVDWFLILFAEMGAILTCSVYLYYSNLCLSSAIPEAKPFIIKLITIIVLYVFDVFYFVDMSVKIKFFHGSVSWFSVAMQSIILIVLLFVAINQKGDNQPNKLLKRRLKV